MTGETAGGSTGRDGCLALGELGLSRGGLLRDARLTYRTHGALNAAGDNCILLPAYYSGSRRSYDAVIGPGRAFDPAHWFIVATDVFGNGHATSPSHATTPAARAAFPIVSVLDNVRAQHRLLDHLGVGRIALLAGWSMAAVQGYCWAAADPLRVRALLAVCGASRCWPQNRIFLHGLRAAMEADARWQGGAYVEPPLAGVRAFARVYAGWAYSPRFFREGLYRRDGHASLDALLQAWEDDHLTHEAADLMAVLDTWAQAGLDDIPGCEGDPAAALRRITARTIAMPCDEDRYFTVDDNALEVAALRHGELRPLHSPQGHAAGAPGRYAEDWAQVERAAFELLADA